MSTPVPGVLTESRAAGLRPPLDEFDLAIRLETEGVTDEVASAKFGYRGALAMAEAEFPRFMADRSTKPAPVPAESWIGAYARGVSYALPMVICAAALALQGFSLWGGGLDGETASAVGAGVVSSFVIAGGFVQGLASRMSFHLGIREPASALRVGALWAGAGFGALLVSAAIFLLLDLLFRWMPFPHELTAAGFGISLGALFLASGALYVLEMRAAVAAATLAGLMAVSLLVGVLGIPLLASQLIGIWVSVAAAAAAVTWRLSRMTPAGAPPARSFTVPRELYLAGSGFIAGALYYLLLFADRLMAWTAGAETTLLPLLFRGDYETAMDLGMIVFVLGTGWVHASVAAFRHWAGHARVSAFAAEPERLNRNALRRLLGSILLFLPFPAAAAWAVLSAAKFFGLAATPSMERVLLVSLAAYCFLVIGLWSRSILDLLNLQHRGIAPAAAAVAADFAVGYVATRAGSYDLAAYGFLAGSIIYAAGMTRAACRASRRFDHAWFASGI